MNEWNLVHADYCRLPFFVGIRFRFDWFICEALGQQGFAPCCTPFHRLAETPHPLTVFPRRQRNALADNRRVLLGKSIMPIFRSKPAEPTVEGEVIINSAHAASANRLPHRVAMVVALIAACFLGYNYAKRYGLLPVWMGDSPKAQVVVPPSTPGKTQPGGDVQETVLRPHVAAPADTPPKLASMPSDTPAASPPPLAIAPVGPDKPTPIVASPEVHALASVAPVPAQVSEAATSKDGVGSGKPEALKVQPNVAKAVPATAASIAEAPKTPSSSATVAAAGKAVDTRATAKRDRQNQPDSWQEGKRFF
jgi:hypothetical protein